MKYTFKEANKIRGSSQEEEKGGFSSLRTT